MANLAAIVRATRASARALADCNRISFQIRDAERRGETCTAAIMYSALCRAQRRYAAAQIELATNPLPGDKK